MWPLENAELPMWLTPDVFRMVLLSSVGPRAGAQVAQGPMTGAVGRRRGYMDSCGNAIFHVHQPADCGPFIFDNCQDFATFASSGVHFNDD